MKKKQIEQYSRHILLPEIGFERQKELQKKSALIIGLGGLGCIQATYLAAAGIGHIGLVDDDTVEHTNLQRQIIYGQKDLGRKKVTAAADFLQELNPDVQISSYDNSLSSANAMQICADFDVILDSTDNFASHYLINDVAVLLKKAHIFGSIFRFEGQTSFFAKEYGPCYRCLYPDPPQPGEILNCEAGGVYNHVPGILGLLQSAEALKYLYGLKPSLTGKLLLVDILTMNFEHIEFEKRIDCQVCGTQRSINSLIDYESFCGIDELTLAVEHEINPKELSVRLTNNDKIILLDVREKEEHSLNSLPGASLVPFSKLADHCAQIQRDDEIVVYCRTGIRSARALRLLHASGFNKVWNLKGGITAWIDEIDPSMIKY